MMKVLALISWLLKRDPSAEVEACALVGMGMNDIKLIVMEHPESPDDIELNPRLSLVTGR